MRLAGNRLERFSAEINSSGIAVAIASTRPVILAAQWRRARWLGLRHIPGMNRLPRRALGRVLAPLAALGLLSNPASAEPDPFALALGDAMGRWATTLDEEQRDRARYAFDDAERFDLRLAPMGLEGLRIDEMSDAQWQGLHTALGRVLSEEGLQKVDTIRSLESEVAELESWFFGLFMRNLRDPKRYFLSLFGEPSGEHAWGMRFDGHHLSLNWTAIPGAPLSVTPLFLGGQPREVPEGLERAGLRVLAAEEDHAVALVRSLSQEQRSSSALPFARGGTFRRPMFVGADPELSLDAPAGIARTALAPEQQNLLDTLVDAYLANFARPLADRHREHIQAEAQSVYFAYATDGESTERGLRAGDPFYYRIQGETFLIEFDDTSAAADHVHVVWRELQGDFGRDVLAEHYRAHHTR